MAAHENNGLSDEWYTPSYIFEALGCRFDMDVASPGVALVHTPTRWHLTNDSLGRPWVGFVWMNPPYGGRNGVVPWMRRFINHGNGIALVPNRAGAPWWQEFAKAADLICFVSPKIKFIKQDGTLGKSPGTASCLIGIGPAAIAALQQGRSLGWLAREEASE